MIQTPKRAVTRFFIPLIDVLILLFCIFLLMPLVEESEEQSAEAGALSQGQALELLQEVESLRAENERLRQTRELPRDVVVRTLEIDPDDGSLVYHDGGRKQLASEAEVRALVQRDRAERGGQIYLILYPRKRFTGFPTLKQRADYEAWFQKQDVKVSFDIPN